MAKKLNPKKKEKLFQENYSIVKRIARKYLNWNEPLVDLEQVGSIGLLKAIDNYSKKKGCELASYAGTIIDGEIRHYLRDKLCGIKVSRKWIELNAKINKVIEQEKVASGKRLSAKTIARKLKVKEDKIDRAKRAVYTHYTVSLNKPITSLRGGDGKVMTLEEVIGNGENCYEEMIEHVSIKDALATLSERDSCIIKMMFVDDAIQSKIAKKYKITQAQVSRIVQGSLHKLKESLV